MMCRFFDKLCHIALLFLLPADILAQQISQGLTENNLVYSVNRFPEKCNETPRAVQVITEADIIRKNARTLPELLMEETGLFIQQTNYGGGSPIIRGLMGKQILILVDGVIINNSTYRFGPLQYLNTIDLEMVARIEIVRGVVSVLGTYALGGTINIITKKDPPNHKNMPIGASMSTRYSSADGSAKVHTELYGRTSTLRYFAGATGLSNNDITGGGHIGEQTGTGYDEWAANANIEYFISPEKTVAISYQHMQQTDVPRTDRLTDGTNKHCQFNPQILQLASLSFEDLTDRTWINSYQATFSVNNQFEGRQEIRTNNLMSQRNHEDEQLVLGGMFEAVSLIGNNHRIVYGIDYSFEQIASSRVDENLSTGTRTAKRGNYTDGAEYNTFALYGQSHSTPTKNFTFIAGARYNSFTAQGNEMHERGSINLDFHNNDLTYNFNLIYHATPHLNLIANAIQGFRAPNLDDISVLDDRGEAGIEIPNLNVSSENVQSYEFGLKFANNKLSGSLFGYSNKLSNLLTRSNGTFEGLGFFDANGNGVQDEDEVPVLQKKNIGEASIYGIELDVRYKFTRQLEAFGNIAITRGTDALADVPLRRIPPPFGTLGLRWRMQAKYQPWLEFITHAAARQNKLNPGDESDSRIGPEGTDGFTITHIRSGLNVTSKTHATFAVENLFDQIYKYHGSGVYRPGRQIVLGLRVQF